MSSPLALSDHPSHYFDNHRHHQYHQANSHGTHYASSPLPSPPLSTTHRILPNIGDRGRFLFPFISSKQVQESSIDRDDYEGGYSSDLELKPITNHFKAQTQMLPPIQQIVTPSNSPSPQPITSQVAGLKPSPEYMDIYASSSESSTSAPSSRKGSIASLLNTDDHNKHVEQPISELLDNNIVIQMYEPEKHRQHQAHFHHQKNEYPPAAVLAPRGRPPHSISGNRKRRLHSECVVHESDTKELSGERDRKRYRSAPSSQSYGHPVSLDTTVAPPIIQQQRAVGLRHFSQQVCKKVREKQVTTYNAVANELASDIQSYYTEGQYDQKNIRRRVYDALNVLMAMDIIAKDRKEIRWLGISGLQKPTANDFEGAESSKVQEEKMLLEQRIKTLQQSVKDTKQKLVYKIKKYAQFRNLINRNVADPAHSGKQLPLPLVAFTCKNSTNHPVQVHDSTDSITVTGNLVVNERLDDTAVMDQLGLNQVTRRQHLNWFPSNWHPFCSGLIRNDSH